MFRELDTNLLVCFTKLMRMTFQTFIRKFCVNRPESFSSIAEVLSEKPEGTVKRIKGWIKSIRKMRDFAFVDVNDGSCFSSLQVVSPKNLLKGPLQWGSSVEVTGKVQINKNKQTELEANEFRIVGPCVMTDEFPFTPKEKRTYEFYRQYLHFRPKIKYFTSINRLRSALSLKIHEYFNENDFVQVNTPIITSNDCEGGGETFMIKPASEELIKTTKKPSVSNPDNAFFDLPSYLTVSGQLHLEAFARSISKVYTFSPCFRANLSNTRFHLSEFYMVEAEEAFITDLQDVLDRMEDCIKQTASFLISKHLAEVEFVLKDNKTDLSAHMKILENLINKKFTVMSFLEAKDFLNKNKSKIESCQNSTPNSLNKSEEAFLVKNNDNLPIFVVNWPKIEKPFYMKELSSNPSLVKGVDLLAPNVGELCGGSIREDNYDILKQKLIDNKILGDMEWYLNLRKYGNVPTGGFGLGFERLLQFLLNIQNIKDTIPFPRYPHGLQL